MMCHLKNSFNFIFKSGTVPHPHPRKHFGLERSIPDYKHDNSTLFSSGHIKIWETTKIHLLWLFLWIYLEFNYRKRNLMNYIIQVVHCTVLKYLLTWFLRRWTNKLCKQKTVLLEEWFTMKWRTVYILTEIADRRLF